MGKVCLRYIKTGCLLCFGAAILWSLAGVKAFDGRQQQSFGDFETVAAFSPSNARTADGKLIPVSQFFSAARCAKCHADTHAGWSESLHRNAAREPFYRESADILLRTRGIEATRHCESCHTPVALFSGALAKESGLTRAPFTSLDDEGVTCTVCHSITEARLNGTGSYTIRRPALLAREDGTPIYGDFTDEQILADVPAHKRAVMRPMLRSPEFCATCHKVDAPPALNNYKHIRGFSAYDEWQQSGASQESVQPFYRREQRADCRACHMPRIESLNDRAAKQQRIASHRWLGANTAAPLFYQQQAQAAMTAEFLRTDVLDVDLFAVRRDSIGEQIAPLELNAENCLSPMPGEEVTVEVVVSNRNAAHSFPPEVRDLYEAWVELEAVDHKGQTIFHSGYLRPDGMLDESAHVYKQIILDPQSRPITRHQIWLTNIKAYDNAIPPGRSDVVRYRMQLPAGGVTLRARVKYRRFNQEYTQYVLSRQNRKLTIPVVQMAEAQTKLMINHDPAMQVKATATPVDPQSAVRNPQWKRWNDYGIGLLEQAQYGPAAMAFRRAAAVSPRDPDLLTSAAIAEMRTERFGQQREQWRKAGELLDAALALDPRHWRARFFKAQQFRGQGRLAEAAEEFALIAAAYPRDREVLRALGQTWLTLGRTARAQEAFEGIAAIDPTDFGAWQYLTSIYSAVNRPADAERAQALYLNWRDDPLAYDIVLKFFAAQPQWSDERIGAHVHGTHSAHRPILQGTQAAPVN